MNLVSYELFRHIYSVCVYKCVGVFLVNFYLFIVAHKPQAISDVFDKLKGSCCFKVAHLFSFSSVFKYAKFCCFLPPVTFSAPTAALEFAESQFYFFAKQKQITFSRFLKSRSFANPLIS